MSLHQRLDDHRSANRTQATLLVMALTAVVGVCGFVIGGFLGLALALLAAALIVFSASRASAVVLRMYKAQPVTRSNGPELLQLFDALVDRSKLTPPPQLYYVPSNVMNAFAVGSGQHAAIAVTAGLLQRLNPRELAGVLAHELSHVQHNDLYVMNMADALSRVTTLLGQAGQIMIVLSLPAVLAGLDFPWLAALLLLCAPAVSAMLQLALSRSREYSADVGAVQITGDAMGLASALAKIEQLHASRFDRVLRPGLKEVQPAILRTHPHTADRVKRLAAMAGEASASTLPKPAHMVARSNTAPSPRPQWRVLGLWY